MLLKFLLIFNTILSIYARRQQQHYLDYLQNNNNLKINQQQHQKCLPFPTPFKTELSKYSLNYPYLDKYLALYMDLKIHCEGFIIEWHFLSAVTVIWGLHLAVFRPLAHNEAEYAIVDQLEINGMTTRSFGDTWAILKLDREMRVLPGDVLGVFYDRNVTDTYGALSIRSMGRHESSPTFRPNTLLFQYTAEDLGHLGGIISTSNAHVAERLPGLYVMLSALPPFNSKSALDEKYLLTTNYAPKSNVIPKSMLKTSHYNHLRDYPHYLKNNAFSFIQQRLKQQQQQQPALVPKPVTTPMPRTRATEIVKSPVTLPPFPNPIGFQKPNSNFNKDSRKFSPIKFTQA